MFLKYLKICRQTERLSNLRSNRIVLAENQQGYAYLLHRFFFLLPFFFGLDIIFPRAVTTKSTISPSTILAHLNIHFGIEEKNKKIQVVILFIGYLVLFPQKIKCSSALGKKKKPKRLNKLDHSFQQPRQWMLLYQRNKERYRPSWCC